MRDDDHRRTWERRERGFVVQATVLAIAAPLLMGVGLLDATSRIGVVAVGVALAILPFAWLRDAELRLACVEIAECFVPVLAPIASVELHFLPEDLWGLSHGILVGVVPIVLWAGATTVGLARAKASHGKIRGLHRALTILAIALGSWLVVVAWSCARVRPQPNGIWDSHAPVEVTERIWDKSLTPCPPKRDDTCQYVVAGLACFEERVIRELCWTCIDGQPPEHCPAVSGWRVASHVFVQVEGDSRGQSRELRADGLHGFPSPVLVGDRVGAPWPWIATAFAGVVLAGLTATVLSRIRARATDVPGVAETAPWRHALLIVLATCLPLGTAIADGVGR